MFQPLRFTGVARNPFQFQATPSGVALPTYYFDLSRAPASFWSRVRSDGGDIRVLKQDGVTPLARQLVSFNTTSKTGSLWLKGDAASSFWITHGNALWTEPAAASTYGRLNAYEAQQRMVLHGANYDDSTSNGNNASITGGVSVVAGKVENAIQTSLQSDLLTIAHNASQTNFSEISLSVWVNWSVTSLGRLVDKNSGTNGVMCFIQNADVITVNINGSSATTSAAGLTSGAWHLLTFVVAANGAATIYVDGVSKTLAGTCNAPSGITSTGAWYIMNRVDKTRCLVGAIDEYSVVGRALPSSEVANMYANQNSPATFWTIGNEVQT
jgi:hypothetical protein